MKVLISTLLTLSVGTALAAPATTTSMPGSTGTSATTLESVAPKKSPLSFKYEGYVEKSQKAVTANKDDLRNENDLKITYKLSDAQSLRLLVQAVNTVTEGPNDKNDTATRLGHTYLQYAHSGIVTVGSQAIDLAVRNYFPTSQGYRNSGQTYQTRIYLSTDFEINERLSISAYINPRFYGGSDRFENADKARRNFMTILEPSVKLSDNFSWTTDIIRQDVDYYNANTANNTLYYIESWISATLADKTSLTEKISLDVGLYNENSGNGMSFAKKDNTYFSRLHVNF